MRNFPLSKILTKLSCSIFILLIFAKNQISSISQFPSSKIENKTVSLSSIIKDRNPTNLFETTNTNNNLNKFNNNYHNNKNNSNVKNETSKENEISFPYLTPRNEISSILKITSKSNLHTKSFKIRDTESASGKSLSSAFNSFTFTKDPSNFQRLFNDSADPEELFSISNYSLFNYSFYPESSKYSKTFLNTKKINGLEFPVFTKADFSSEATQKNFSFSLIQNLERFLGKDYFSQFNSTYSLRNSTSYINFIKNSYKKRTILIGIDGLAPACINWNDYAFFKFLTENGSFTVKARSASEGVSGPGWSTILCSLNSEQTGIVDNSWSSPWLSEAQRKAYVWATPLNGLDRPFPCLLDELKRKNQNLRTAFYSSWEFFHENFSNEARPGSVDVYVECLISKFYNFYEWLNCDEFSLERSKNLLLGDFDFYFWYMSSLDIQGHKDFFCSASYFGRLEIINNLLLEFFEFVKALGLEDKLNIIITSDHGTDRKRISHGNDYSDDNLFVPLFMIGPDFKQNNAIGESVSTDDIAPTVMHLLGVTPNPLWMGKPLTRALKSDKAEQAATAFNLDQNADFLVSSGNRTKLLCFSGFKRICFFSCCFGGFLFFVLLVLIV